MTESNTMPPADAAPTQTGAAPANTDLGYADALQEIETILTYLNSNSVDIDKLGSLVERAAALINNCRGRLAAAEASVTKIVAQLDTDTQPGTESDAEKEPF